MTRILFLIALFPATLQAQPSVIDSFLTAYPLIEGQRSDSAGYELRGMEGDTLQVLYDLEGEPTAWTLATADSLCSRLYMPVTCVSRGAFEEWFSKRDEMQQVADFQSIWRMIRE